MVSVLSTSGSVVGDFRGQSLVALRSVVDGFGFAVSCWWLQLRGQSLVASGVSRWWLRLRGQSLVASGAVLVALASGSAIGGFGFLVSHWSLQVRVQSLVASGSVIGGAIRCSGGDRLSSSSICGRFKDLNSEVCLSILLVFVSQVGS